MEQDITHLSIEPVSRRDNEMISIGLKNIKNTSNYILIIVGVNTKDEFIIINQ